MSEKRMSAAALYVSCLANCVLSVLLWATLKVAPSEVFEQVQLLRTEVEVIGGGISNRIDTIQAELDKRGEWMGGIDKELERRTHDRVYRSEIEKLISETKERNPDLDLPTLPASD